MRFWKPSCTVLANVPKFFARKTKRFHWKNENTKIPSVFWKLFAKCFPGHINWCFENHALNVFAKSPENFRSSYEIYWVTIIFRESYFVKMFSWTHRMWVLKACLEFFRSDSQNFFLKVQNLLENITFLNVIRKMITWTPRLMFWKRCPKCSAKVRNFSARGAKITEKSTFFQKKSSKPSSGFAECSFVTPWRNFCPKNQKDGQIMEEVGKPWYSQK